MPLLSLSAHEARKRTRDEVNSWPTKPEMQSRRLVPIASPQFNPSFRIAPSDLVFTIGSCFARNIERQMLVEGCRVAISEFDIPAERLDSNVPADAILNRFVCFTMLNELRWALDPEHPFPQDGLVELRPDKWVDLHAGDGIAPSTLERAQFRRDAIRRYMALAGRADVIVVTLGLAEGWFDTRTGHYANLAPFRIARDRDPDRFQLHQLEYNEITGCLDEMHALLSRFGRPGFRMLVTVSPIPMKTTFTGADVLVANTYSKAVQRAALEYFSRKYDNVDYFPSYESVTLSDRERAWEQDLAHASDEIVRLNVLRMLQSYLVDPADLGDKADLATQAFELVRHARKAAAAKNLDGALETLKAAAALAPDEALIRLEYGKMLYTRRFFVEAVEEIEASVRLGSEAHGGLYSLARALAMTNQVKQAYRVMVDARKHEPTRPALLLYSAALAEKLRLLDQALEHFEAFFANPAVNAHEREKALADYLRIGEAAGRGEETAAFARTLETA